jgi:hypothetical protein
MGSSLKIAEGAAQAGTEGLPWPRCAFLEPDIEGVSVTARFGVSCGTTSIWLPRIISRVMCSRDPARGETWFRTKVTRGSLSTARRGFARWTFSVEFI